MDDTKELSDALAWSQIPKWDLHAQHSPQSRRTEAYAYGVLPSSSMLGLHKVTLSATYMWWWVSLVVDRGKFVKTISSFAGYLLRICPPGEKRIQVKPEVFELADRQGVSPM